MPHHDARRGPAETVLGTLVAATRWLVETASPPAPASASSPDQRGPDVTYVVLGAVGMIEDRVRGVMKFADRTVAAVAPIAGLVVPPVVKRAVDDTVHWLDERGRATAEATAASSAHVASTLAGEVVHEQMVTQIIMQVVDEVLPLVIEKLNREPEQVRALVQSQTASMAEEVTRAARSRAADGDDLVDRIVARLHLRKAAHTNGAHPDTAIPPTILPAGP